ncbi:hypothetical protein BKA62DRAFT_308993 [Auriculariales sp. MPI-PUGE-AT-0066]|nr:hypothetical protein BKA62DRAFT_308993 [Auriculariales sp. MPI-PUGE-AT-0066]
MNSRVCHRLATQPRLQRARSFATTCALSARTYLPPRPTPTTTTTSTSTKVKVKPKPPRSASGELLTHFRITLRRSAIALPERFGRTLTALGLHRRMRTVFQPHGQVAAGMILKVKELVEVQNVPASAVRTQAQMRQERRPARGYVVEEMAMSERRDELFSS